MSQVWMFPSVIACVNALLTWGVIAGLVFGFGLKHAAKLAPAAWPRLGVVQLALLAVLLYAAHYFYRFDRWVSPTAWFAVVAAALLLAVAGGFILQRAGAARAAGNTAAARVCGVVFAAVLVLTAFVLAGFQEKPSTRARAFRAYEGIAVTVLGGEGELAVLRKHPEELDGLYERLFARDPEHVRPADDSFALRLQSARNRIAALRREYYRRADDDLLDAQLLAFVHLVETTAGKDRKICARLLLNESVEEVYRGGRVLNDALNALDEREAALVNETRLSAPVVEFDREQAVKDLNGAVPPGGQESPPPDDHSGSDGETPEQVCDSELKYLKSLAGLPREKRAPVARLVFAEDPGEETGQSFGTW
ncbi:MAG: hypothetical protein LBR29_04440 [Methylobacteriaceae bacterium]|jgi:hypothetical protein|nr:hypothetical protein [Methylobacteriaceae bacterium]